MDNDTAVIETPEATAEELAAFEAGFSSESAGDESEHVNETPLDNETPQPEEEVDSQDSQAEPTSPKMLTLDEFNAAIEAIKQESQGTLSHMESKLFGKIGDLNRRLENMKSATSGFSPRAKERLSAEFPELAEMLFESAQEAPAQQQQQYQAPQTAEPQTDLQIDVDAVVKHNVEATTQEYEKKLLAKDHPDWVDVAKSSEFAEWRSTLTDADNAILDNSWDASSLSQKFTEFKNWRKSQAERSEKEKLRQERLSAAITPQGQSRGMTAADDDEMSAMEEAFKARRL